MPSYNINETVRLTLTPAGSRVWLGYEQSLGKAEALPETTIETTLYEVFTVFGPAMASCQPPMFEGGLVEFPLWGCPYCPGTAVHAPDCPRRGETLPPDPLPLPLVQVPALILEALHGKSMHHRQAVLASHLCGCFYCLRVYHPAEIREWVARDDDDTAICPYCSVDSVLPGSDVDITPEMLKFMQARWFPHRVRSRALV